MKSHGLNDKYNFCLVNLKNAQFNHTIEDVLKSHV